MVKKGMAGQGFIETDSLTISGCLGPCDVPNIVTISNESGTQWLGNIDEFEQYRELLEWAVASRNAARLLPLPQSFRRHTIDPFRHEDRH